MKIYLFITYQQKRVHTHTHPIILFRAGRGNLSEKRIKELSIKMVFRPDLEIQVLTIHEGGKNMK